MFVMCLGELLWAWLKKQGKKPFGETPFHHH